jgi:hypothetical protein
MIKINLLPPHIHQRKQVKVAVGIVVVMLAAEIGGLLAARSGPLAEQARLEARQAEVQGMLNQVKAVESQAATVLGEEAALAPKYNFITEMLKYNTAYPDLYTRTAGYTYREVTFLNLEATANQLKFDAYVSSPSDVARLMIGLSNSPDFTQLPTITGVPNYDAAERRQREAELNESNIPDSLIIGGVAGAGMSGGYPGMGGPAMGGYPGMSGSGYPGMSGPEVGPPGMSGSGAPAMGAAEMGGYPGSGGGGGGGDISKFGLQTAKLKPRGFTITVTCGLKNPISRPTYGNSESQLGGGGGGMMGGYPGMMGGGPPGPSGMSNGPM